MRTASTLIFVLLIGCCRIQASDDTDYASKIIELSQRGTPGTPELVKYLKTLSKDQLFTALRQYCSVLEAKKQIGQWDPVLSMCILTFYAEPLKRSDLSDEKFNKMGRRAKRNLAEGLMIKGFSDAEFGKVIATIADEKEDAYLRFTLVDLFRMKEFYPHLKEEQKDKFVNVCLAVSNDRKSPAHVRERCFRALTRIYQKEYSRIIYADKDVAELRRSGPEERIRKLTTLINTGEIKLSTKTTEQLAPWREKIFHLHKMMLKLEPDDKEPASLKQKVKMYSNSLEQLPLIDIHSNDN